MIMILFIGRKEQEVEETYSTLVTQKYSPIMIRIVEPVIKLIIIIVWVYSWKDLIF